MLEQAQIDEIILQFERHVRAESMKAKVGPENCIVADWPPLVPGTLSDLLWDITIYGTFASIRLTDLVWSAWYTMMEYVPHDADETHMVMMWDRKIEDGAPEFGSLAFKQWLIEAMALFVSFANKVGEDEISFMQDSLNKVLEPAQNNA